MSRSEELWEAFVRNHSVGDRVDARIVRVVPFGALVELAGGVPGLLVTAGAGALGDTVAARIREIDPVQRRVAVQPA